MRAEQPTKLCKPRRKIRAKVWYHYNWFKPPVNITDCPKAGLSGCVFLFYFFCFMFMFGAVQFLNVLILTLQFVKLI